MSIFKQTLLTATLCGIFGVAAAAPEGDSSQKRKDRDWTTVKPGESDSQPFGKGKAGLAFSTDNGHSWSNSINLENGPVKHIGIKYKQGTQKVPINGNNPYANVDGTRNPKHLRLGDVKPVVGWFYNPKLGQVWYENRHNKTEVYSVRQITEPKLPFAPKFGGLVIAKVPGMGEGNNVFFGEWAPRKGNPSDNSTDLNMADSKRTVWYVGDNPTRNMPKLVNAKYNVLGVNKHTPGRNDFYTGTLTANYGTGSGSLTGSISRPGDSVNFAGTNIRSNGTFDNGKANEHITGRFYGNSAEALAGIVDRTGADKDVAFGGRRQ
ncbi:Slam-dependent surface lipoprotein [Neisseria elongata]|uniref:Slam-dependent surface lipoprotein n=1 Tax=Neisseria elongata TaxID=495 RepID=UPI0024B16CF3|nr:Slam-dependent surface lipoprotein [Neisseria elongata]